MSDEEKQLCVFCVARAATTHDHVPPKAIFPRPRPDDLITVPACPPCNGGHSQEDEAFSYYLSLYIGIDTPTSSELFHQRAIRTGRHNMKLHHQVVDNARSAWFSTPSGIVYDRAVTIPWDSSQHASVLERMVRGLYYHHLRKTIPADRVISAQFATRLDGVPTTMTWNHGQTGGGSVRYACCIGAEDSTQTWWLFSFYDRLFGMASSLLPEHDRSG